MTVNQVAEMSAQYLVDVASAVPVGYKQTEVGVIPEDWDVAKLSQLAVKIIDNRGKTPPLTRDGEFELIETASISFVGIYPDYSKVTKSVSKLTYENWFRGHPRVDDVLISTVGEYSGASALMGITRGTIAQNLIAIRFTEAINSKFIFYWTRSEMYRVQLEQVMMNQAQPSLRVPWLLNFEVCIPPKKEQTAIANALSDVDALISELEKLIAKKQAIKTATMQQLLTGRTRLPQFALREDGTKKGYKQSELGEVPEDWEVERLADLLNENPKYGINAPAVPLEGKLPVYIRITDISDDGYFRPSEKVGVRSQFSDQYQLRKGDLVLARTGASVGKSYLYREDDGVLIYAGFLIKLSPDIEKLDPRFLSHYLKTDQYWSWVTVNSMRSGQPGINGNEYGNLLVPCPKPEEQSAISTILSDMDSDIQTLEQRLNKTRQIKQGMMQELLTGKTRLVKPEQTVDYA